MARCLIIWSNWMEVLDTPPPFLFSFSLCFDCLKKGRLVVGDKTKYVDLLLFLFASELLLSYHL